MLCGCCWWIYALIVYDVDIDDDVCINSVGGVIASNSGIFDKFDWLVVDVRTCTLLELLTD